MSSDVAGWLSALATAAAALAAAFQLWRLRQDGLVARAAELDGVAVETDVVVRPTVADARTGLSKWVFRFSVHNPGRLPISAVKVTVHFSVPVTRLHVDGPPDAETMQLKMHVPVIPAGQQKDWKRVVLLQDERRAELRKTTTTVTFTAPDVGRLTTTWPGDHQKMAPPRRIRKYLRAKPVQVVP